MGNNDTNTDLLLQYLDNELDDTTKAELEKRLANESALNEQLLRLQLSRQAVQLYGLKQRVKEIGSSFQKSETQAAPIRTAKVRNIGRWSFGVAAVLLLLVAGVGLYEYSSLSNNKLYAQVYQPYEVRPSRGSGSVDKVEAAYKAKDYQGTINNFQSKLEHSTGDYFYVGEAYLELNDTEHAITNLENAVSSSQISHQYTDESEFYLALAYLKSNNLTKAQPLFEKIHSNQNHLFHKQVNIWFMKKFHLLQKK